jgi:hypothetical protein
MENSQEKSALNRPKNRKTKDSDRADKLPVAASRSRKAGDRNLRAVKAGATAVNLTWD